MARTITLGAGKPIVEPDIMPSLRGHHLICLHFFNGEGYNSEYIENLRSILRTAESKEIKISSGRDDICIKCPYLKDDTCQYSEDAEKEIKEMDNKALDLLKLSHGININWNKIKECLPKIFLEWYELYCRDCKWKRVCEKNDFFQRLKSEKF